MPGGKNHFNPAWCSLLDMKEWLAPGHTKFSTKCNVCMKEFSVEGAGIAQVRSHAKSKTHSAAMKELSKRPQLDIRNMFSMSESSSSIPPVVLLNEECAIEDEVRKHHRPLVCAPSQEVRDAITKAEITYCLHVVETHSSMRSTDNCTEMFRVMFPDSEIAKGFTMAKDKVGYIICFGLGEYYKEQAMEIVRKADQFVLQFDESLNKVAQRCQMDVHARYIDGDGLVATTYIGSQFLGHATAVNMAKALNDSLPIGAPLHNIIQLGMDGPSVNWKLFTLIEEELLEKDKKLLDIGSCGLHVVHNAFKTGFSKKSEWNMQKFLRACYYTFKDSPARRAEFIRVTGSHTFPMKFVGIRWLENGVVVARAIAILSSLEKFANAVRSKEIKTTTSNSLSILVKSFENLPLLRARLEFFLLIATELEPFLREFQNNAPLAPMLYEKLQALFRKLMKRFVDPNVLKSARTGKDLLKIDLEKNSNLRSPFDIDIGFGAKRGLHDTSQSKQPQKVLIEFRTDCRCILKNIIMKLAEKSPLKYALTRGISALDPEVISSSTTVSEARFKVMCEKLIDAGRLPAATADAVSSMWSELLADSSFVKSASEFSRSPKQQELETVNHHRLDVFYKEIVGNTSKYSPLFMVIQTVLMLSHGNAEVERGFSTNKNLLQPNLSERSLVAQRLIHQAIRQAKGSMNIVISKEMLVAARLSAQRRCQYLKNVERNSAEEHVRRITEKRKLQEIRELQKKKKKLASDCEAATRHIDEEILLLNK